MFSVSMHSLFSTMALVLFSVGVITLGAGVFVLVSRVLGQDLKLIAEQTAHLVKKGLAEEVSGLVGNAASLLDSLTQLIRTATGVGVFLVVAGMMLIFLAYVILRQA